MPLVSSVISGLSGASYGSSTPVRPVQLPVALLGVETLHVALGAQLDRRRDVHFDEAAVVTLAHRVAGVAVRRDDRAEHDNAVAAQQLGDEADARARWCGGPQPTGRGRR